MEGNYQNMEINDRPLYQSYRIGGRVFAGEYPGDKYGEKAETKEQEAFIAKYIESVFGR